MQHHAFVIEAGAEKGIELAQAWAKRELGMKIENNPDIVVLHYGLLSVDDARRVADTATGVAFVGENRVIIIAANRAYHEAQNALLKLFEEPPQGTYLFLVLPTLGSLLPTLRSRVQILQSQTTTIYRSESAKEFLKASKEKRSALIKKLTNGKDEEERRENREEAITLLNGIEAIAYTGMQKNGDKTVTALLADIVVLRDHLYDRSAPVRMILEHISLVIPKGLSADR
jgi:DNA polymerase III delta prime subunit